jgi:hypothetical protein
MHAADKRSSQSTSLFWCTFKGSLAYYSATAMIQIQNRSKAEVEPYSQYLCRHHPPTRLGKMLGLWMIGESPHRGETNETLSKPLDTPAFLIDCQQQIRPLGPYGFAQLSHLARMLDITSKNDEPTHFGLAQEMSVFSGQPRSADIHH